MKPKISLEHWQALIAVVESGSYARASANLNKSQSTISYAISKIEELLGVKVFKLVGRKAELTEAGQSIYRQSQFLVNQAAELESRATSLAMGWESQLSLAVEILFPHKLLLKCLDSFSHKGPEPRIELYESVLGGTEELLQSGKVDLAICSQVPSGYFGDYLMHVKLVLVASPIHPLHQLNREITLSDLRHHRQLVVRDSGSHRVTKAALDIGESRWTVSSRSTSIDAASMGLGFSWFPKNEIEDQLRSGELKPLPLQQGSERLVALYLAFSDPELAGPGTRQLAQTIRESVADLKKVAEHAQFQTFS